MSRYLTIVASRAGGGVLPGDDLTWYRRFLGKAAPGFLMEHQLHRLCFAQQLDLFVVCRNALAPGGRLRFSLPDRLHPSQEYRHAMNRSGAGGLPDAEGWASVLSQLGFVPHVIEGYRRDGTLVEEAADFGRFGSIARSSRLDPRHNDPAIRMSSVIIDAVKAPDGQVRDGKRRAGDWPERIFAMGDSHVRFLAGRDETSGARNDGFGNWYESHSAQVTGLHIGPALAFNTNREGTKTRALERVRLVLDRQSGLVPAGARLIFSFGEIDCRCQVIPRAEAEGRSIEEVVDGICGAYIEFLDEVARGGFRPSVWCPIAPTWITHNGDAEYPIIGTFEQRLAATRRFGETMSRLCHQRGFPVLSVLNEILGADGQPQRTLYADAIHLGQRARPLLNALMPLDPPGWALVAA